MDKMKYKNIEQVTFYILLTVTALWFTFFINRGIDVTDAAYCFVKYKYAFVNKDVINVGTFLTDLAGACVYHLSSTGQVLLLSVSHWLLYMGSGVIVYQCLKKYVPRLLLLAAVLCGSFFSLTWIRVLHYNSTSMFMQTAAICVLIKGIEKENIRYYVFSGILLGLNIFFRLPNVLQVCVGAGILWYFGICKKEWKRGFQRIAAYGLGVAGGFLAGAGLCFLVLGKEKIMAYFFKTANTAMDSQSSHGIWPILLGLFRGARNGLRGWAHYGILIVAVLVIWNLMAGKKKLLSQRERIVYIVLAGIMVLYGIFLGCRLDIAQFILMTGPCIWCVVFAGIFYYRKINAFMSAVCAVSFCAEAVLCIGTDVGWYYHVVFMIFPLSVCISEVYNCQSVRLKRNLILCAAVVGAMVFAAGVKYATSYVYRDAPNNELKYPVMAEEYKGIRTSKERAGYLDELLQVLNEFEGEELLSYGDCNIGQIIADMPPLLSRIWVDLAGYPIDTFETELEEAIEQKGYPVVLIADLDQDGEFRSMEKLEIIKDLLREGEYTEYYKNEWYCVYKPGK